MITFSLWCTGLLTISMRRCTQKVPEKKRVAARAASKATIFFSVSA